MVRNVYAVLVFRLSGTMTEILNVSRLCKSFGALKVADRISFDVRQGEILGIIGPNGAGKTTLFGLLAGNIRADSGHIRFDGADLTRLPAHDRARAGLARTYQIPRPFTHMTVLDNLMVAARFGGDLDEAAAAAWVERVIAAMELRAERNTLAGRLPLLTRKRHELARALAMQPKLILIDEVAAGLTDAEVERFIELIRGIRDSGITVVWIEHVMKTMLTATDRLIALDAGRLLVSGPPQEVINASEVRRVYLGA